MAEEIRTILDYTPEGGWRDVTINAEQAAQLDRLQSEFARFISTGTGNDVRAELVRSGLPAAAVEDAVFQAISDVVENGPDCYLR
jgi:hypothetical protein